MVVATAAKVVATVLGADIYEITETKVITSQEAKTARSATCTGWCSADLG